MMFIDSFHVHFLRITLSPPNASNARTTRPRCRFGLLPPGYTCPPNARRSYRGRLQGRQTRKTMMAQVIFSRWLCCTSGRWHLCHDGRPIRKREPPFGALRVFSISEGVTGVLAAKDPTENIVL